METDDSAGRTLIPSPQEPQVKDQEAVETSPQEESGGQAMAIEEAGYAWLAAVPVGNARRVIHSFSWVRKHMAINNDKPGLWKKDIEKSVDMFNTWFIRFAPKAYRNTRVKTTKSVEAALVATNDLSVITPEVLKRKPGILPTLRMATCPPLARDRLIGLAYTNKNLVKVMEDGKLPKRMTADELDRNLRKMSNTIVKMLDRDIFPWLRENKKPTPEDRHRSSTIVADRLCGAVSDPIIRNAQEKRQLAYIEDYLKKKGYRQQALSSSSSITSMTPGTYSFRTNVVVGDSRKVNIPIDAVIQPRKAKRNMMPLLIEAKSAGDFTNTNKRRKEEATKIHQLRLTYGEDTQLVLFLCGYFDSGYLGYEAAEGIDWVWEHRIQDLDQLGL